MNLQSLTGLKYLFGFVAEEPARVWRHTSSWGGGLLYPRYKRPAVILPTTGGLGDNLMFTAVAREVRRRNPDALIHVITHLPEVFERNPDIDFVSRKVPGNFPWLRPFRVTYNLGFPWRKHFIHHLCACVNITNQIDLRTYIFPDKGDWNFADKFVSDLGEPPIVIARTGGIKTCDKKLWPRASWLKLVNELIEIAPVVDIGTSGNPLEISNPRYRSLLGRTSLHQLAALIGRAKALVTVDTGSGHIAAAFDIPTVCILGGVFPPEAIRYPNTTVLVNRPECFDCWPVKGCLRNLECMANIKVEEVLQAVEEMLGAGSGTIAKRKVES